MILFIASLIISQRVRDGENSHPLIKICLYEKKGFQMPRGGARVGAGRPAGRTDLEARGKRIQREINKKLALEAGKSPLDFLLLVMQDKDQKINLRMQAAVAAAPYCHAKLSSVEVKGDPAQPLQVQSDIGQALAALAELARQQSGQVIDVLPADIKESEPPKQDSVA